MGVVGTSASIVVVGNEKGGTGKTTVAMHLAVGLLRQGVAVGTVDLDAHQRSLTRYLDNRRLWREENAAALAMPLHRTITPSAADSRAAAGLEEEAALRRTLDELGRQCEVVLVDCPGGDGTLSRLAHGLADVLVTPLNDSFVDLDLLLEFRPGSFQVLGLGVYFQMLWEIRNERRRARRPLFDWIVVRNRLSGLADQNKRNLVRVLEKVAPIMRFRLADGLGERIIFRQLFQQGLTAFDIEEPGVDILPTRSHAAARDEIGALLAVLGENARQSVL